MLLKFLGECRLQGQSPPDFFCPTMSVSKGIVLLSRATGTQILGSQEETALALDHLYPNLAFSVFLPTELQVFVMAQCLLLYYRSLTRETRLDVSVLPGKEHSVG